MREKYIEFEDLYGDKFISELSTPVRFCYPIVKLGPAANCHEPGKEHKEPRWKRRAKKNGKPTV